MARAFTASGHNLRKSSPTVVPGPVGTVALWVKPISWSSGDSGSHPMVLWIGPDHAGDHFVLTKYSDNFIYGGWYVNTTDYRVIKADTGLFTAGTWVHLMLTWSDYSNNTTLWVNGAFTWSGSTLVSAGMGTEFTLGNNDSANTQVNADNVLAEFGLWDVEMNEGEMVALAAGYSPRHINRAHLLKYHPLDGRTSPEPCLRSGEGLTVTGTAFADHPRVIRGMQAYAPEAHGPLVRFGQSSKSAVLFVDTSSSTTWSHTCNADDNFIIVSLPINCSTTGQAHGATVTYNGVSCPQIAHIGDAVIPQNAVFGLVAPATGTHNVVVTWPSTAARTGVLNAMSFSGVNQVTPYTDTATFEANANGTTPQQLSITTPAGGIAVDAIWVRAGGVLTLRNSAVEVMNDDPGAFGYSAAAYKQDASAMGWDLASSGSAYVAHIVVALNPTEAAEDGGTGSGAMSASATLAAEAGYGIFDSGSGAEMTGEAVLSGVGFYSPPATGSGTMTGRVSMTGAGAYFDPVGGVGSGTLRNEPVMLGTGFYTPPPEVATPPTPSGLVVCVISFPGVASEIPVYDLDDIVRVIATYTDPITGLSVDPPSAIFKLRAPAEALTSVTPARQSAGVYTVDLTANKVGTWRFRWQAVGTGEDGEFVVVSTLAD